ncbi:uncharacterized protein LOC125194646 [Salvia hispanica]|uniref:uncharacterized protein LOC125194646 n=1 Tax=Salvia hispanica TaxID=49212 RepID=UPI0020096229|nr:uncharacterized protein LOC125194646 [Salvia hispanica]
MATAAEIMQNLTNLFGTQNRTAKSQAFWSIMAKTMKEGSSVRDHVLEMMSHLNQIEVLVDVIDAESQVTIILQSLSPSFQQFKLNFEMNKRNYTLAELLIELQSAEDLMNQAKVAMVSSTHRSSGPRPSAGRKKVTNQVVAKETKGKKKRRSDKKQP